MDSTTDRLDALEAKSAFQEDTIASLNDALVSQQTRMDALERLLDQVLEELKRLRESADPGEPDPPPPHY